MIGRYLTIRERIRADLPDLERSAQAALRHWQRAMRSAEDQDAYINSVAFSLHSFYTGLERILELIALHIDGVTPSGSDWHAELLKQMSLDLDPLRPPVLREEMVEQLDDLRRFRHLVRNIYAPNLDLEKMRHLLESLPLTWQAVRSDLESFLFYLDRMARADEV